MKNAKASTWQGLLAAILFVAISLMSSSPASADGIPMLPPIDGNGNVCNSLGMLQWDGQHAITCIPGFSGNVNTGDVTQTAPITLNGLIYVGGPNAALGDNNSSVIWEELAEECHGSGNVGVDQSGTLHCCPLGTAVIAADYSSVTCGLLKGTTN